ncbi:MAG: alpha/beta hydrolase [Anaerolineales bacterium]
MTPSLSARFWRFWMKIAFRGSSLTVTELRARDEKSARWRNRLPPGIACETIQVNQRPALWLRPAAKSPRVMLYLHGGGYVSGSPQSYQRFCAQVADRLQLPLLLPDYRLAPENPFPAALEDALAAYRWLLAQGWRAENIFLGGDSAGGGLALAAALALRDSGEALPAALLCLSPWTDLTCGGETHQSKARQEVLLSSATLREWGARYSGGENPAHPLLSPLYADFHGLPPLLIQVGSEEILLADSLRVTEKARSAGVPVTLRIWDGMWHVWPMLGALIPESGLAFDEMKEFIRAQPPNRITG